MVLANTIAVCVAVPVDNEATRIRLCPAVLSFYLYKLGGFRRTCQAAELFVVDGESFDFLHKRCVGGGEQGDNGGEFLEYRIFFSGGVSQVVKTDLKFFLLDGFSS